MKAVSLLCVGLAFSLLPALIAPLTANAWQLRNGGGARTFVLPHGGNFHNEPPPPHPQPGPMPQPTPRPMPPSPHPGPPPPEPHPGPYPGPHPYPGPPPPRPMPPPPPPPPPPYHGDDWYHPWAAAAVVGVTTATVLAIGTRVTSVPPNCVSVVANGVAYQQCGSTWYQPQYMGSTVQFVVVRAPW